VIEQETVSPYLHNRGRVLYNPVTGASIRKDGEEYRALSRIREGLPADTGPAALEHLRAARFLIEDLDTETRRSHLLFLSLETCTSCNHRCPFCPVSVDPREREVMSQELFESIVDQTVEAGGKDVVIFLSNYNEPTIDPLFEERCRALFDRGLAVSILTNASHFGPERARRLEEAGRFRYIGINLPTLDPERYEKLHGTRDLARVIANIEGMRARELARETAIVVLGEEDERHLQDAAAIRKKFEPLGWQVKPFRIRSRPASGTFVPEPPAKKTLKGCELMGSRPFEHLHVTATAKAVLCCQDYYEKLTIGDLKTQSVAEVLGGDVMARLRRWTYGVEEAPADFLCRRCEFALGE
jgi:wyosine [tRNA(Phe)-imidazoG37] synthetase (radical SAM superfamily)